ncbi:hypothetical protein GP721_03145 [Enterobacteriaceae bacterium TzEc077]|uniref:EpsG family protein n=1 Tax=Escherichia coli TaxID=562 RepID=UPI001302BF40|nr:EpsG family protein [Escherichia coli]KAE9677777.1 hypothetical protein GP720_02755 [Escherichia coli]KAE9707520.1 hypothetical protein GP721_03145 [Enterobacteriaceae bacterium TzEc077]
MGKNISRFFSDRGLLLMPVFFESLPALLYFSLFLILLFLSGAVYLYGNKKNDYFVLFFSFAIAILFHGTRAPDATDLSVYYENFKNLTDYSSFPWGYSFYVIYSIISIFTISLSGFVFATSLILLSFYLFVILIIIKGNCKSIVFLVFLLSPAFTDMAFNTIRQGMAIPFLVMAVYCLYNSKKTSSAVYIIISAGFHWNAPLIYLISVASIFLYKKDKAIRLVYFLLIGLLIISIFVNLDIAKQSINLLTFGNIWNSTLQQKMDAYLNAGVEGLNYYDLDLSRRIFSILELAFYIYFLNRLYIINLKSKQASSSDFSRYIYFCFLVLSLYSILLISMTWYFRNFYWALGLAPVVLGVYLSSQSKSSKNNGAIIIYLILQVLILSIITTWRSGIMYMSYS